MGTPLPPSPAGVLCPLCFSPGAIFQNEQTPLYVNARFVDLQPGPQWSQAVQDLLQDSYQLTQTVVPCIWTVVTPAFNVFFQIDSGAANFLRLSLNLLGDSFQNVLASNCETEFVGQSSPDPSDFFFGGRGIVEFV